MANLKKEIKWLLEEKYQGVLSKNFEKDVARIKKGEPLDYVIGFTEFLGCKIDLSKKPLIPRPETEFWVGQAIEDIKINSAKCSSAKILRILDIFAGSGCIGIALLKKLSDSRCPTKILCDFVDIEKRCIEQIKINLKINGVSACSIVRQLDVFKVQARQKRSAHFDGSATILASQVLRRYDYIFANPPYIAKIKRSRIQKSVLNFEPNRALFGGKDGFFYIRKFLSGAKKHLNQGGKIYMEFDPVQKQRIGDMIKKYEYKNYKFFKDQYGKWRFVMIG